MPRIKHWFPVNQDINSDPEVLELTDTFGDWLLSAWLQILSVTDRAEGEYRGSPEAIAAALSSICQHRGLQHEKDAVRKRFKGTNAAYRAEAALWWMTLRRWLLPIVLTDKGEQVLEYWPEHREKVAKWCRTGGRLVADWLPTGGRLVADWWPSGVIVVGFKTRNHWKYHKTREPNKFPSEPSEPSEPLRSGGSVDNSVDNSSAASPDSFKKERKLDPRIKEIADKIFESDEKRFSKLAVWIKTCQKRDYDIEIIIATLEVFWKHEQRAQAINWWAYLDSVLKTVQAGYMETQSQRANEKERQFLKNLIVTVSRKMNP